MAPVVKELEKRGAEFTFIHTGQHHDYEMSKIFQHHPGGDASMAEHAGHK